jgi:alpha-glucosidase
MRQVPIPPERVQDPFEKNVPGLGLGRDGARTPMQWDASDHAGFSRAEPWLPLADDYAKENVAGQRVQPDSLYSLYRRLIAIRRERRALRAGAYRPIVARGDLLLFVREYGADRVLVVLNLGPEPVSVRFPAGDLHGHVLVSAFGDRDGQVVQGGIELRAHEGVVMDLDPGVAIPDTIHPPD